jgi:hypothetical protein
MSIEAQVKRPPQRCRPSERDEAIYFAHKVRCCQQKELAAEYRLSKGRVSQIVARVRDWLADLSARDGELDHGQRLRLERRLERERMVMLYGESLRMLQEFEQPADNSRKGTRKGEDWSEETKRDRSPQRIQALKAALKAAESLGKIAERDPAPTPGRGKPLRADDLFEELIRQREEAEAAGRAPAGADAYDVAWYLLQALAGEKLSPVTPGSGLQTALVAVAEALGKAAGAVGNTLGGVPSGTGDGKLQNTNCKLQSGGAEGAVAPPGGAKLAKPADAHGDHELPPEVAAILAASGWWEPSYGGTQREFKSSGV